MAESRPAADLISVAVRFNDRINARDADGLAELMTENHRFIDSGGNVTAGRQRMRDGWQSFFDTWPDYRNVFERVVSMGDRVVMLGRSYCADESLDGPAIWVATVHDGRIDQWRVLEDTPEARQELGLEGLT